MFYINFAWLPHYALNLRFPQSSQYLFAVFLLYCIIHSFCTLELWLSRSMLNFGTTYGKFLTFLPLFFCTCQIRRAVQLRALTIIVTVLFARKQTKMVDGWEVVMLVGLRDSYRRKLSGYSSWCWEVSAAGQWLSWFIKLVPPWILSALFFLEQVYYPLWDPEFLTYL